MHLKSEIEKLIKNIFSQKKFLQYLKNQSEQTLTKIIKNSNQKILFFLYIW